MKPCQCTPVIFLTCLLGNACREAAGKLVAVFRWRCAREATNGVEGRRADCGGLAWVPGRVLAAAADLHATALREYVLDDVMR